ncbi:MAG: tyrosine-protein phosphatase [Traorella sp.]
MIDIHSHILPLIDDGAYSVKEALKMLISAYEDGTDEIVLTPHMAYPYGFNNPFDKIKSLFEDLNQIIENERIPIKTYLGCEYLFSSKEEFEEQFHEITTINNTNYLLIEFYFDVSDIEVIEAVDTLLQHHLIPIIAHPERFDCIKQDPQLALSLIHKGALLQMNKGSILGRYGRSAKECALELLDKRAYHFVGSDAHSSTRRTPLMYESYSLIQEMFGKDYAFQIYHENANKMLQNIDIRKETL